MGTSPLVACALSALMLAGCTQFAGPEKQLSVGVSDASTAVTTSHLALDQYDASRTSRAAARTTASDMLTAIGKASQSIAAVSVSTPRQLELRRRAVACLDSALDAVLEAEAVIDGTPGSREPAATAKALERAAKALSALSRELPAPR